MPKGPAYTLAFLKDGKQEWYGNVGWGKELVDELELDELDVLDPALPLKALKPIRAQAMTPATTTTPSTAP